MKLSKKLLVSILATASLFGISLANQNNTHANASMRHYTRYINGKYNAYHNVPGRRNAYLMHYGHNYRNDRVSTYGTYYKFGRHYTKINRARHWFGYMNVKGLNTRPIRIRVKKHAYRRSARRTYRKPIRKVNRVRKHKTTKQNPYVMPHYVEYEIDHNSSALTSKGLRAADLDALNGLNQIRESQGKHPLQWDADLQKIADIRVNQLDKYPGHYDPKTGKPLAAEISRKYGMPYNNNDLGENFEYKSMITYSNNPKKIGYLENKCWIGAPFHIKNRENNSYTKGAIAINNYGSAVEDFA